MKMRLDSMVVNYLNLLNSVKSPAPSKIKCLNCDNLVSPYKKGYCKCCSQEGSRNSFYGKKHSKETKQKISESQKGKIPWNRDKQVCSEETKKKISESKKGTPAWNKGKAWSEEVKNKISTTKKKKALN